MCFFIHPALCVSLPYSGLSGMMCDVDFVPPGLSLFRSFYSPMVVAPSSSFSFLL